MSSERMREAIVRKAVRQQRNTYERHIPEPGYLCPVCDEPLSLDGLAFHPCGTTTYLMESWVDGVFTRTYHVVPAVYPAHDTCHVDDMKATLKAHGDRWLEHWRKLYANERMNMQNTPGSLAS